jgi:hypothetical protein
LGKLFKLLLIILGIMFLVVVALPAAISVAIPVFAGIGIVVVVVGVFWFIIKAFTNKDFE